MLDILHQLYKDMVANLMSWIIKSIKKKNIPKQIVNKKEYTGKLKLGQISNLT